MTPTNIESIVRGLTKAQRVALRRAATRGFGFPSGRLYHAGRPNTGLALSRMGLVTMTGALTPLGLSVRQYILEQEQKHD